MTVNSFSLSRGTQDITGVIKVPDRNNTSGAGSGAFYNINTQDTTQFAPSELRDGIQVGFQASRSWTGSTNSVAPQTSALGSGSALDVTPAYYTCHMWLRLT